MNTSRHIVPSFDDILNARTPMPPMATIAFSVALTVMKWEVRHRTRKSLRALNTHELNDIGIEHERALTEANRWFWQG